jgi:uncharacterized membrane protein YfcA
VIVPSLVLLLGFDVRRAAATSLAVIALNCAAALLGRVRGGGVAGVDWGLAAVFSAFGVAGAVVGGRIAHRLPQVALRRVFAGLVVAMAAFLLWTEFG